MADQIDDARRWLDGLASPEGKRREATIRAIAARRVRDERLLAAMRALANSDPVAYVKTASQVALLALGEDPDAPRLSLTPEQVEIGKLEFLITETTDWPEAATRQPPYLLRLAQLQSQLSPTPKTPAVILPDAAHEFALVRETFKGIDNWRAANILSEASAQRFRGYLRQRATVLEAQGGEQSASAALSNLEIIDYVLAALPTLVQHEYISQSEFAQLDASLKKNRARLTAAPIQLEREAARTPAMVSPAPPAAIAREPRGEPVPFDQWLLSERNIKLALYSGGVLLVLAGLIFIGVNWAYLPGLAKFAITFGVTVLLYGGGLFLLNRALLRLGGIALLAIASAFVPLNFAVLHLYLLDARAVSGDAMWVIGSLLCAAIYVLLAFRTRHELFAYFAIFASASLAGAALSWSESSANGGLLTYSLFALALLIGSRAVQRIGIEAVARRPLLIVAWLAAPLLFLASIALWAFPRGDDNPWLALAAMLVGVLFYVASDALLGWLSARWIAAFTFALTLILVMTQLRLDSLTTGILLKVLALAYLGIGYLLQRQSGRRAGGIPLYAAGYAVAAFVTLQGLSGINTHRDDLMKALLADVAILAVSARVHRQYGWLYGAAWLFIAPVFLYASLNVPATIFGVRITATTFYALAYGTLMLVYAVAGYLLARRGVQFGAPFLSVAAFLSVVVVALAGTNWTLTTGALLVIAALYLFFALWLRGHWLVLATLGAMNLALLTGALVVLEPDVTLLRTLVVAYGALGVALALGAARLRGTDQRAWGAPLYLVAAFDLAGAFLSALSIVEYARQFSFRNSFDGRFDQLSLIALSMVFAALSFGLAWFERAEFQRHKLPPLLSYVGVALVFIASYYVMQLVVVMPEFHPALLAALCAIFVLVASRLEHASSRELYGHPLWSSGLVLMLLPLAMAVASGKPSSGALTFALAAGVLLFEGVRRREILFVYLGGAALVVVIWYLLNLAAVTEGQAYVAPLGVGLLALGWKEWRRGSGRWYQLATTLGLALLMGTAFYQSLSETVYALLLLGEGLAAFAWGVRTRSRVYVQFAMPALIVNALAQYGPAFAHLDRWIQIGAIGAILLGGGLAALFRRERILAARQAFAGTWKQWQP